MPLTDEEIREIQQGGASEWSEDGTSLEDYKAMLNE